MVMGVKVMKLKMKLQKKPKQNKTLRQIDCMKIR